MMSVDSGSVDIKGNLIGYVGNGQMVKFFVNGVLRFEYYWKEGEKERAEKAVSHR